MLNPFLNPCHNGWNRMLFLKSMYLFEHIIATMYQCHESHTPKLQIVWLKQIISSIKPWSNWNVMSSQTISRYVHGCCVSAEQVHRHTTMISNGVCRHLPLPLANSQIKGKVRATFIPFCVICPLELKLSLFNKDHLHIQGFLSSHREVCL